MNGSTHSTPTLFLNDTCTENERYLNLPKELFVETLSWLPTYTLVCMKVVSQDWSQCCTTAIDKKLTLPAILKTNEQLCDAVRTYVKYDINDAEKFAATLGWPINKWNVNNISNFSYVFFNKRSFNEKISAWDVSNATTMERMFINAYAFNQSISSWDTSKVTEMKLMFDRAKSFNQDISSWNTSKVINMECMFEDAESFNQDISSWDTSKVIDMTGMFCNAKLFNQDLSSWSTSKVLNMDCMFEDAVSFNKDLSSWDISQVQHSRIFLNAKSFNVANHAPQGL